VIDSIYWVITLNCNDYCSHCYNASRPGERSLSEAEAQTIVSHLPRESPSRVVLSGGEPLTQRQLLFTTLDSLHARYGDATQYMLQTNGDRLTPALLDEILEHHVTRIDIASIDRYHRQQGSHRQKLEDLFRSRGMSGDETRPLVEAGALTKAVPSYGFWGANEDFWIGGNWPRGRAIGNKMWFKNPGHNFCAILSGAIGFLGGKDVPQEVAIQLAELYPCCPSTAVPLADLRVDTVDDALARVMDHPMWRALNDGDPWAMGGHLGISREAANARVQALGSVCLWCDEFFGKHYEGPRPARATTFVHPDPEAVARGEAI
jgi:hypothetical protein